MRSLSLLIIALPALALCWFFVPGAYYDADDGWTGYIALGATGEDTLKPKLPYYQKKSDTTSSEGTIITKYLALEARYAPESNAKRGELRFYYPLFGLSTRLEAKYTNAKTIDPRKIEIYLPDADEPITPKEHLEELFVRLEQRYRAGVESYWGFFADYRRGKYKSDYRLTIDGFEEGKEQRESEYVGGGIFFGYDTRKGDMDPITGYAFHIELSGAYRLTDSAKADYINSTKTSSPKATGNIYVEQILYTPSTALPVEIPLLTVQAPTTMALKTAIGYYPNEVPQILAYRANDGPLMRGLPHNRLAGNAFFIVSLDVRILPIERMYTPISLFHLIAPRLIPDIRGDLEVLMFTDIGKFWGANPEKQVYSWGGGLGMKLSKRLTVRAEFAWNSTFNKWSTYFFIRPPF